VIEAIETAINLTLFVPFWLFGLWWLLFPQSVTPRRRRASITRNTADLKCR
jgi:hypothetical protein